MTIFDKTAPIRLRIPRLLDVLLVSDPEQIRWLNARDEVDRTLDPQSSWLHRYLDQRLRIDMGFDNKLLPVFLGRGAPGRRAKQQALSDRLEDLHGLLGAEHAEIADYVAGQTRPDEIGVAVQQWCGRLFLPRYQATRQTYQAGKLLAGWPTRLPWRAFKDRIDGRLDRAKNTLRDAAEGDLHCIHATSIGTRNMTRSVRKMRRAAHQDAAKRLSPDEVLRDCLVAPPAVLRSCTRSLQAPFLEQPLTEQTLIVFLVARAYDVSGDIDVAFLSDGWSACPAQRIVPEVLRSVWHAAHHGEPEPKRLLGKINGWSRILGRA